MIQYNKHDIQICMCLSAIRKYITNFQLICNKKRQQET